MPFGILWPLLWPLLKSAIEALMPWLIEQITSDVRAGRTPTMESLDIKGQLLARKEVIRRAYKGATHGRNE